MTRDLGTINIHRDESILLSCRVSGFPDVQRVQFIRISIDSDGIVAIKNKYMEDIPGVGLIKVEAFSKTKAEK